ncbi:hypothetical protein T265_15723, partial [Opisthorchis viverrini]
MTDLKKTAESGHRCLTPLFERELLDNSPYTITRPESLQLRTSLRLEFTFTTQRLDDQDGQRRREQSIKRFISETRKCIK